MGFISDINRWAEKCVSDPVWVQGCLGRIGRFGGQHPESNVLRHSLSVCHQCRDAPPEDQLWALYHDAHEILTGEITRPFKTPEILVLQVDADLELMRRFGIDPDLKRVSYEDTLHGDMEARDLESYVLDYRFSDWCYQYSKFVSGLKFIDFTEKLRSQL